MRVRRRGASASAMASTRNGRCANQAPAQRAVSQQCARARGTGRRQPHPAGRRHRAAAGPDLFIVDRYLAAAASAGIGIAPARQQGGPGIRCRVARRGQRAAGLRLRSPALQRPQRCGHRCAAHSPAWRDGHAGRPIRRRQIIAAARTGARVRGCGRRTDARRRRPAHDDRHAAVCAAGRWCID